jgi:hypothetical protein
VSPTAPGDSGNGDVGDTASSTSAPSP